MGSEARPAHASLPLTYHPECTAVHYGWWVKREYHDRTLTNQTWTEIRNELTEIQVKN